MTDGPILRQDIGYYRVRGGSPGMDVNFAGGRDFQAWGSLNGARREIDYSQFAGPRTGSFPLRLLIDGLKGPFERRLFLSGGRNLRMDHSRTFLADGLIEFHQIPHKPRSDAPVVNFRGDEQLAQVARVGRATGDQAQKDVFVAQKADGLAGILDGDTNQGSLPEHQRITW